MLWQTLHLLSSIAYAFTFVEPMTAIVERFKRAYSSMGSFDMSSLGIRDKVIPIINLASAVILSTILVIDDAKLGKSHGRFLTLQANVLTVYAKSKFLADFSKFGRGLCGPSFECPIKGTLLREAS